MEIRYQLLRPFAFAWIKAKGITWFRFYIPLILTGVASLLFAVFDFAGVKINLAEIIVGNGALLMTLPGFYIAALAAVSSFTATSLDRTIEQDGATVKFLSNGVYGTVSLTYRVYLCFLFAYLTVVSAALAVYTIIYSNVTLAHNIPYFSVLDALRVSTLSLVGFFEANLAIVTLHGLYFLAERMHRP